MLELGEIELPNPEPSQVMVEVAAAGLNRADCLQRRGFYPAPPGVPADVPGLEFAGVVESVGDAISAWKPGDRVMGIVGGGSMATRVVTEAAELMPVPKGLSLEEAAAVPEVFLTAYDAIVLQGGLQAGQTVLLHAVASGVGTAAIQIASALGATTVGTSRTAHKLPRCTELGLTHAVLVEEGQFADTVLAAVPEGANVVLDTIGAAYSVAERQSDCEEGPHHRDWTDGRRKRRTAPRRLAGKTSIDPRLRPPQPLSSREGRAHEVIHRRDARPLRNGRAQTDHRRSVTHDQRSSRAHRMDANETFGKLVLSW